MSAPNRDDEDLNGLFAAFGGDVDQYQEFNNAAASADPSPNWTLLKSLGADPNEAAAASRVTAPAPLPAPVARPPATAPVTAPSTAVAPGMPDLAQVFRTDPAFKAEPVFQHAPVRAPATVPATAVPAAAPLAFAAAAVPTPAAIQPAAALPPTTQAVASSPPTGTPLAALFDRLSQAPEPDTPGGRSLMAHWRQSR